MAQSRTPSQSQSGQQGSRRSCPCRRSSVQIFSEYQRRQAALSRDLDAALGLWTGQYPSRVKAPQPGCRQGRSGFNAIGLSPPGQNKNAKVHAPPLGMSWALAFNALASRNIQDDLSPACPAIDRKTFGFGVVSYPKQAVISLTHRTSKPSILYDQFTTPLFHLQ